MDNEKIMADLSTLLKKQFPGSIDRIILFGSRQSKTAADYSDYDILVVVNHEYDWKFEGKILDASYNIDLKYDIVTDIKIISKMELSTLKGRQPFIQAALSEGLAA